jgi:serine/threonine protein kinase
VQPVQTPLPIGTIVQARYIVEAVLATRACSAVYLVRDQRDKDSLFALKELIDPDQRELEHFFLGGAVLSRLDHPALPHVYQVFDNAHHHRVYMLMKYVEGPNLEALRQQQPEKRFSLPQVLMIMAPIMDAVAYLHRQNPPILHRDIKPSNIIVPTTSDVSVLVDFGIAKEYELEGTTTAVRHCSAGYSAPEQYTKGTSLRSDIYGLGATLYRLLTGQVPPNALRRMVQISEAQPDPLVPVNRIIPSVPMAVSEAIQRALSINRNHRFSTVEEFWQALTLQPTQRESPVHTVVPSAPAHPVVIGRRPVEHGTRAALRKQPPAPLSRNLGILPILLLVLGLLIGLGAGMAFSSHIGGNQSPRSALPISASQSKATAPLPTSIPRPTVAVTGSTPAPASPPLALSGYPQLAGWYEGSIYDIPAKVTVKVSITSIQQDHGNIRGSFTVDSNLHAHGLFSGTLDTSQHVRLTAMDDANHVPILFSGAIRSDGTIGGSFCSLDGSGQCTGQYGVWSVTPGSSGQHS